MATLEPAQQYPAEHHHRRVRRKAWTLHATLALAVTVVMGWYWFRIFGCWSSGSTLLRENVCRASFVGPLLIFVVAGVVVWQLVKDLIALGEIGADSGTSRRQHFRRGVRHHPRHATAGGSVAILALLLFALLLLQLF